ncbi:hypothetical protein FRC08_006987 [Ceratobasidium sp. 394]|nr:hypothetical protein FRC08_006987 [Ceratobasidium sp. 394]KAG9099598.1 hypothetical protein FS749_000850 [Ceratobasidium sp. UAMH 11750]
MVIEYSLDQLTLKRASRAQEIESRKISAVEWAKWLTLEAYLRRDEEAEVLDHAKDGRLITWVLVPATDPETLDIMCACETYQRNIFLLPPNETKSVPATGYGIASVFTPPKFRRKGYAAHMMSLLHFAIAKPEGLPAFPTAWGAPPVRVNNPGVVSVLYSDVGTYYARCAPGEGTGWTVVSPTTTEWIVESEGDDPNIPPQVEFLSRDEAIETTRADADLFKQDLESQGPSPRIHFAFQTTAEWCWFQMHRDDEHPLYLSAPPKIWGVRIQHQDETHFIVWAYEPSPKRKLIIINLRASSETFPHLLAAIKLVARTEKHGLIEVWNLHETLLSVAKDLGGRVYERQEHLPAIKWYGEQGDVVWFGNDKLRWC